MIFNLFGTSKDLGIYDLAHKMSILSKEEHRYKEHLKELIRKIGEAIRSQQQERKIYEALAQAQNLNDNRSYDIIHKIAQTQSHHISYPDSSQSHFFIIPYIQWANFNSLSPQPTYKEFESLFRRKFKEYHLISRDDNFFLGNFSYNYEDLNDASFGAIRYLNELTVKESSQLETNNTFETFSDRHLPHSSMRSGIDIRFMGCALYFNEHEHINLLDKIKDEDVKLLNEVFVGTAQDFKNESDKSADLLMFFPINSPGRALAQYDVQRDDFILDTLFSQHPEYGFAVFFDIDRYYLVFWDNDTGHVLGYTLLEHLDSDISQQALHDYFEHKIRQHLLVHFFYSLPISLKEVLQQNFDVKKFQLGQKHN
jgi:hypothetical protein